MSLCPHSCPSLLPGVILLARISSGNNAFFPVLESEKNSESETRQLFFAGYEKFGVFFGLKKNVLEILVSGTLA